MTESITIRLRVGIPMKFRYFWKIALLFVVLFGFIYGNSLSIVNNQSNECNFARTMKKSTIMWGVAQYLPADDPNYPFDIFVNALSYYSYYGEQVMDTAMYGSFTSSIGIDFFICDQENFDLWTGSQASTAYEISNNVGSKDWTFIAPYTDTWYVVFDNTDNFNQAHVVGTNRYDVTAPTVSWNLAEGHTYSGTIDISVTASDEGFGVDGIQLYIDSTLVEFAFTDTLTFSWETNGWNDGEHTVRVEVSDELNHVRTREVDVIVSNIPSWLVPVVVIGIGTPVIIGVVFVLYRKMKPSDQIHTESEPVVKRVVSQPIAFCPSCGAARQPPGAGFCSNCGSAFPE
jgi:hypothetical protein